MNSMYPAEHQHHQLAVHSPHGRESGLVWLCFPTRCGCTDCTKFLRSFATTPRAFCVKTTKVNIYIYICIYCFFGDISLRSTCLKCFKSSGAPALDVYQTPLPAATFAATVSTSAGSNAGAYRTGTTSIQVSKAAATSMFRSQGKEWNERN